MRDYRKALLAIVAVALLVLALRACNQTSVASDGYIRNRGFVFGTTYSLIYKSESDHCREVLARLAAYDSSMSVYNKASLLSQLNAGDSVVPDSDMLFVLNRAKFFHELTGGAFDVTVEPLSRHWRFTRDLRNDTISVEKWDSLVAGLDSVRALIGFDKLSVSPSAIVKANRGMKINANALAEGRGIDLAAEVLESHGITDYMVELGGEIHCKGLNPKGQRWRIGIDRPIEGSGLHDRQNQHIISVSDRAVSTSGSYRQCYHVADGRTVQHTIDPRTGMPVNHAMLSVTVVGRYTLETDALCTSLMVMGPDSAFALLDKAKANGLPEAEGYIIFLDADGQMQERMTPGFEALIAQ